MQCSEVSAFCQPNDNAALHLPNGLSSQELSDLRRVLSSVKFIKVQFALSSSLITMSNKNNLNNPVYGEFFF